MRCAPTRTPGIEGNTSDLAKLPDARKLDRLRELFERAYDSNATLRDMLFSLRSVDVVRIIEGTGEQSAAPATPSEL